jgi:hypothetical protein
MRSIICTRSTAVPAGSALSGTLAVDLAKDKRSKGASENEIREGK